MPGKEVSVPTNGEKRFLLLLLHTKCKHEQSGQETDRGFECLDAVSAGEAH